MRPGRTPPESLTRRALGSRITAVAAVIGAGAGFGAGQTSAAGGAGFAIAALDPALRDAALRGLALAGYRGDPITAAAADAALARLAETDPEAAVLGRLYRLLDVRPAAYWPEDVPEAAAADLATLHAAIHACRPVGFGYTDLSGNRTERSVLPLALVHPPQGVKLLAWCRTRADFRQFFVRAMTGLAPQPGGFEAERLALLQGFLQQQTGRG